MRTNAFITALTLAGCLTQAVAGPVEVAANADLGTTTERLLGALEAKGMTIFAQIDHAAGAAAVGSELAGNRVIIFGNPKIGTALMQCDPAVGLDLPMRMQIRETAAGAVTVAYWSPETLAAGHDLQDCAGALAKIEKALGAFAEVAAAGPPQGPSTANCTDPRDTYNAYDDKPGNSDIRDIRSEYYVLAYSWAPGHCDRVAHSNKRPGGKDFLQCGSGRDFGYIVHGLWPQGEKDRPGVFPRACEGDQVKVDRAVLEKYLCMTPSLDLLQHEWEFHGTCMHDETLETPDGYFGAALALHSAMTLPDQQLPNTDAGREWFHTHNPHLVPGSIKHLSSSREWLFCFDNDFNSMACPGTDPGSGPTNPPSGSCPVKGNLSGSGRLLYFTADHRDYPNVKIDPHKGERCFATEAEAEAAGWTRAP